MAIESLNCQCCGAPLKIVSSTCECEYCGNINIIGGDAGKYINQLNRANKLRQQCEFDHAYSVYDIILSENTPSVDVLWSQALCEYGIEYVPDPISSRYFPTLHRIKDVSFLNSRCFVEAFELADEKQKKQLKKSAEEIAKIQEKYLNIASNEKPYDAFICYKETNADSGEKTEDVMLAEELYHELTGRGYKVFFARETLKDKLSIDYEPYIFAALKSSKAMAVIGTKAEYFTSVWVKNEWGRFLKLMEKDPDKMMFFACDNPEELPRAFATKQAQLLGKDDAIKNLAANIDKFLKENSASDLNLQKTALSEEQKRFDRILTEKSEQFLNNLENTDFGNRKKEIIDNIEQATKKTEQTNKKYMLFFNIGSKLVFVSYFLCIISLDLILIYDILGTHKSFIYYSDFIGIFFFFSFILLDLGIATLLVPTEKIIITVAMIITIASQLLLTFAMMFSTINYGIFVLDFLITIGIPVLILYVGIFNKKHDRFYVANSESYSEAAAQIELLKNLEDSGRKEFNEFAVKELLKYKKDFNPTEEIRINEYQFDAVRPYIHKHIGEDLKKYSYIRKYYSDSYEVSKRRKISTIICFATAAPAGLVNNILLVILLMNHLRETTNVLM